MSNKMLTFNYTDAKCIVICGAISIDRTYRLAADSRSHSAQTACYWADEMPRFDEEALAEINAKYKIDTVITHTAPSFFRCEYVYPDEYKFEVNIQFNSLSYSLITL